jgi:hypothetical protein
LIIDKKRFYTLCELSYRELKKTKVDPNVVKIDHSFECEKNITVPNVKFYTYFFLKRGGFI